MVGSLKEKSCFRYNSVSLGWCKKVFAFSFQLVSCTCFTLALHIFVRHFTTPYKTCMKRSTYGSPDYKSFSLCTSPKIGYFFWVLPLWKTPTIYCILTFCMYLVCIVLILYEFNSQEEEVKNKVRWRKNKW